MKKLLLLTLFLSQALYAIVSITPVEIGKNAGWHTKVGVSLETVRGNTDKDNYKGSCKVTYDNNETFVSFIEVTGTYGETNGVEDTKKAYLHYRYIYAISPKKLRAELFLQAQFDKFKEIESRKLAGLGFRLKLYKFLEKGEGYIGLGSFYEEIKYLQSSDLRNFVLSDYITYKVDFAKDKTLTYRLDFQHVYNNIDDYLLIQKLALKIKLDKRLSLVIDMIHDVDSAPVDGVAKNNFTQTTGLVYSF